MGVLIVRSTAWVAAAPLTPLHGATLVTSAVSARSSHAALLTAARAWRATLVAAAHGATGTGSTGITTTTDPANNEQESGEDRDWDENRHQHGTVRHRRRGG